MRDPLHHIVVSTTTPCVTLGEIGQLSLLHTIHQEIWIPQAVCVERQAGIPRHPPRPDLTQYPWLTIHSAPLVPAVPPTLDPGETETIALARANQARLTLFDERRGRRVAVRLGLVAAGSLTR
jgi:predicted nucleic acid-binding protein